LPLREANGFSFSADELLSLITPKTRLIIVNTRPIRLAAPIRRPRSINWWRVWQASNVAILSDEIYSEMLYAGRKHVSLLRFPQLRDRVIMLDGWSKTYAMTGWRMGYAVWPASLVEHATRLAITATLASTPRPNGGRCGSERSSGRGLQDDEGL